MEPGTLRSQRAIKVHPGPSSLGDHYDIGVDSFSVCPPTQGSEVGTVLDSSQFDHHRRGDIPGVFNAGILSYHYAGSNADANCPSCAVKALKQRGDTLCQSNRFI